MERTGDYPSESCKMSSNQSRHVKRGLPVAEIPTKSGHLNPDAEGGKSINSHVSLLNRFTVCLIETSGASVADTAKMDFLPATFSFICFLPEEPLLQTPSQHTSTSCTHQYIHREGIQWLDLQAMGEVVPVRGNLYHSKSTCELPEWHQVTYSLPVSTLSLCTASTLW